MYIIASMKWYKIKSKSLSFLASNKILWKADRTLKFCLLFFKKFAYFIYVQGIEDPNFIFNNNTVNPIYNNTDFVSSYLRSYNYKPNLNQQSLEGETLVIKTADEKLCSSNYQVISTTASTSTCTNIIASENLAQCR